MAASIRSAAGVSLVTAWTAQANAAADADSKTLFKLFPIGKVEIKGPVTRLRIFDEYADGLLGLESWSHVNVLYWFDQNDTPQQRRILRVHPRGNKENPLTGVFACRAPMRPNLIALSVCKILSVQGSLVTLEGLDAFDGTPVLDLKPFIPPDAPMQNVRVPAWAKERKQSGP
ncbi:MAG: tRNA (N6-threonylcarbamoyladenosine(37)-N6)-methyltransferase TrmO [Verrucomicrobia bacterium]|nr:tRNA (N6-threonylcarbamoyladenosine(37)-N6)-methyltransferase TrmO [Verrucomicrobiota bacterium]